MNLSTRALLPALLLAAPALAACGTSTAAGPSGATQEAGDVPTTARALAAIAAEYAGEPSHASRTEDGELGAGSVATELRYGSDGEYDGDMLLVAVATDLDPTFRTCTEEVAGRGGCEEVGDGATLIWEDMAPEEDPGVVYLALPKEDATVLVVLAGPDITADPRELDLAISVDDMLAIAEDPRVDLTTTQEAIDAGLALVSWR